MAYDVLIKDGLLVDGSGMPAFHGDVGVKNSKIVEIGKLSGPADKVVDAGGLVVSPGFVDNHCHYDAQVTWDPLCTYSCYHGATTVIIGNCSLSLAPVHPGSEERLAEFLSYVEAIPMDVLRTVDFSWETTSEYMDILDARLGVNVGTLIGHSAVRHYVMGDECQGRDATAEEIKAMAGVVRDGIAAGALGLSISQNRGHYDPQGTLIPAVWANEEETFALGEVLQELGTGVIQSGGGRFAEIKNRMMSRLSDATGRQVVYNNLSHSARKPNEWKELMTIVNESSKAGIRANPLCTPNSVTQTFTMKNCQVFRGVPTWHPILLASDEAKMEAYRNPEIRQRFYAEVVDWQEDLPDVNIAHNWYDYMWVHETSLEKNRSLQGKTIRQVATEQGKNIIDALLDLVVEEELNTTFLHGELNVDIDACTQILNYPNSLVGLSDGGAHVQFHGGYGYSTRLLGYWVREMGIMPLETAVRKLSFDSASAFGIHDRGLLRPGMVADITIFDQDTVRPLPEEVVYDFPAGGWRMQEMAEGVESTIVNGQILIDDGKPTGALPGRVMRNALYKAEHD